MTSQVHRLAPHVDPAWAQAFILELRLHDVPGRAIGDALAEVESHVAESGEPADGAFGEPAAYAASLSLPVKPTGPVSVGSVARWGVQAAGLLLTTSAAGAWRTGQPLELTTGLVTMVLLVVLTLVLLGRRADQVLRFVVERTVVAWLISMAHVTVLVALFLLLDDVLVQVPAVPAFAVGVVLLLGGTVAVLLDLRRERFDEDPVTGPADPAGTTGGSKLLRLLPGLLPPAAGLVFLAAWWFAG